MTVGNVDVDVDMCGDEKHGFDECGKVHAVRFFTITALLLSLSSAVLFLFGYLPVLTAKPALRSIAVKAGAGVAVTIFLLNFLSICIVASIEMPNAWYSANGSGFVFLILELLLISLAIVF